MSDTWYKRDIRKAIKGMMLLSPEERGCYNTLIDHQYLMGGPLHDDDKYLAGLMNCDVRVWRRIRQQLLDKKRIVISGGRIEDLRASCELATRQAQRSKRVASGQLGGIASGEARKNKDIGEAGASHTSNQIRGEKSREEPPLPPKGGVPLAEAKSSTPEEEFEQTFWPKYPRKQAKKPALKAFIKARKTTPLATIMAGLERYAAAMIGREEFIAHPASFLNGERWNDEAQPAPSNGARQNGAGWVIPFGTAEYAAWRGYHVKENSSQMYDYPENPPPGYEARAPVRWPSHLRKG